MAKNRPSLARPSVGPPWPKVEASEWDGEVALPDSTRENGRGAMACGLRGRFGKVPCSRNRLAGAVALEVWLGSGGHVEEM